MAEEAPAPGPRAATASFTSDGCPSSETLEAVAIGAACEPGVAAHLGSCDRCRAAVEGARRDNDFLAEVAAMRRSSSASTAPGAAAAAATHRAREAAPGYDLHRELHRGAQGVVHEATQRSTHRRVALKLMLHGRLSTSAERRRFEREIEVVAGLRHPGIVTLYDSGTTPDGAAFFAMELVDGVRLDEWLAATPRPLMERLRVVRAIADAVGHAHQRGVIHRDLKPGNVLVDSDGAPRVLDFGLARLSGGASQALRGRGAEATIDGGFAGTFAYAAPEQLTGPADQIDVRADVYAIGLLLHEALAGARTFGANEPPASAIARRLAGPAPDEPLRRAGVDEDLRAIVRQATAVDPARRYQSAAALAEDLDRHAARRPVVARGDSTLYVLRRFAGRHRGAVAFAAVAAILALGAAIVAATLLYQRDRQQRRAEGRLGALHDALVAISERTGSDGAARGTPTTAAEFFAGVAERVDRRLGDDPQGRAFVHSTFGEIDVNLADLDGAERHYSTVLTTLDHDSPDDAPAIAGALHGLGRVHFYRGEFARAESLYRDALARREALFGRRSAEVATTLGHIASCRRRQEDLAGAEALSREALEIREALGGPSPEEWAAAINNLGSLRLEAGDADEALDLFERAHDLMAGLAGPDDWRVAHALRNVGAARLAQGHVDDAIQAYRRAAGIMDRAVEKTHPRRLAAHLDLARCSVAAGDVADARRLIDDIVPLCGEAAQHHQEFREALARFTAACELAGWPDLAAPVRGR